MATKNGSGTGSDDVEEVATGDGNCLSLRKGDLGYGFGLKPGALPATGNHDNFGFINPSPDNRQLYNHGCLCMFEEKGKDDKSSCHRTIHTCTAHPEGDEQGRASIPGNSNHRFTHTCTCVDHGGKDHETLENDRAGSGFGKPRLRGAVSRILMTNESISWRNGEISKPDDLFSHLAEATKEVTLLQNELEAARRHLDSKYKAIKILQSQAVMVNKETSRSMQEAGAVKKSLEKEVNGLQFDLSATQECAMLSQQTWGERFNRVCMENESILATLRARSDQLYRTQLEKKALMRERDELLAMMDSKERLQYEIHRSSTNDTYLHNSMAQQFAVLGACLCRGSKPEPCGCAKAAARFKKENDLLKDEVNELKENLEAASLKADSFLTAFDHQLDQNVRLSEQIRSFFQEKHKFWERHQRKNTKQEHHQEHDASSGSEPSNGVDQVSSTCHRNGLSRSVSVQVSEPLPDFIHTLVDMLNDRTEALAHQRLVSKMLARKTQDLEKTMEQLFKYDKQ